MRTMDLTPLFRSTVGFDQLDRLFDTAFRENGRDVSYPPYNIVKTDANHYGIVMAVAGFREADLEIVAERNVLVVRGRTEKTDGEAKVEYLHKGIGQRAFEHKFQLAEHIEVEGARLEHGMLHIGLVRHVPEAMQPKKIAIANGIGAEAIETRPAA